jgi:hypothetical protein
LSAVEASRAKAKRGLGSRLPASAASTGAAKSRKVTAEETGLPGSPKKGKASASPRAWEADERPPGSSPKTSGLPG